MSDMPIEDFAAEHCPDDKHDSFNRESTQTIDIYKAAIPPRPQGEINAEIRKLRKVIAGLSLDTIQELIAREGAVYKNADAETYSRFSTKISRGGAAVQILERLVATDLKRPVRGDGQARDEFIVNAIATYVIHGGEISSKFQSDFMAYLDALAESAGIGKIDAPKALRFFLSR